MHLPAHLADRWLTDQMTTIRDCARDEFDKRHICDKYYGLF
jgi:hypothetical protein